MKIDGNPKFIILCLFAGQNIKHLDPSMIFCSFWYQAIFLTNTMIGPEHSLAREPRPLSNWKGIFVPDYMALTVSDHGAQTFYD